MEVSAGVIGGGKKAGTGAERAWERGSWGG